MALKAPPEAAYRADVALGFTAGIAGLLFAITVVLEVTGQPALLWALLLAAALMVLTILLVRRRRRPAASLGTGANRQD